MPEHEATSSRTPIEIWVEIFMYYLGPDLANPIHSSLRDYEMHLFLGEEELIRLYKSKQRRRSALLLVSRLWKLIVDGVISPDQIAFVHPENRFRFPPNCDIASAKWVHYLSNSSSTYRKSLLENNSTHDANPDRSWNESTLIIGKDVPLAPIIRSQGYHITFPEEPATLDRALHHDSLLVLDLSCPSHKSDWISTLYHTQLSSLVALKIFFVRDPPWGQRPELFLPNLRCLIVRANFPRLEILAGCRFPVLRCLSITNDYTPTILHLVSFIQRHFATITDLKLSLHRLPTRPDEAAILASCHHGLPRLEMYTTQNPRSLAFIFPHLVKIIENSHKAGTSRKPLRVRLLYAGVSIRDSNAHGEALAQYRQVSNQIKLETHDTWEELTDQINQIRLKLNIRSYSQHEREELLARRRFIDTINRLQVHISDAEGSHWESEAARRYVSELGRLLNEFQ